MISQYHSNMGNTGSYIVRKGNYKYVQFGHYLTAINNKTPYRPQLFDLENDPMKLMLFQEIVQIKCIHAE